MGGPRKSWEGLGSHRDSWGGPRTLNYFVSALSAPLYQKHERGAQLCVWLEDFQEKLLGALLGALLGL